MLIALLAGGVAAVLQVPAPPASSLSRLMPAGALLVLEAKDFSTLVRDWNGSEEKRRWLASANYQVFSRSRLFLRLGEAQQEFAGAAGFDPDMTLVNTVAGTESTLALYDIGKLEFLYVTRLPSAKAVETALWQKRSDYQPRNAAGRDYFVRVDPGTRRTVAFATTPDLLFLATREDLVAGALTLLAGQGQAVTAERWYAQAVAAAQAAGDLRLVMNLEGLVRSPYFRSYWIQRNAGDLRQYYAAIADLHRESVQLREERIQLRAPDRPIEAPVPLGDAALPGAEGAGLWRAWSHPAPATAVEMLGRKVLAPGRPSGSGERSRWAPQVALGEEATGSEADLETRIDEAPLAETGGRFLTAPLLALVELAKPRAMAVSQSSRDAAGGVFVTNDTTVVLAASADWDLAAARKTVAESVATLWSLTGPPEWTDQQGVFVLNGLTPVAMTARGPLLVVSTSAAAASRALAAPPAQLPEAVFAANFNHRQERAGFVKMLRLLESPQIREDQEEPPPLFFSENLASLSATLQRVAAMSLVARDRGTSLEQTVIYRLP
jgi:hypothetical protein